MLPSHQGLTELYPAVKFTMLRACVCACTHVHEVSLLPLGRVRIFVQPFSVT